MWNREASSQDEGARPPQTSLQPDGCPVEERRVVAWVGKSVLFKGDLISLEDMTIDGRVEGTIELRDHNLIIGPDAHISADIVAKMVTVLGMVTGTIIAGEMVDIRETGSVEGNITARQLVMADGAVLHGRVDTGARTVEPKGGTRSAHSGRLADVDRSAAIQGAP
jgi:cytoskeletal protein CcmA (bactofilin family)